MLARRRFYGRALRVVNVARNVDESDRLGGCYVIGYVISFVRVSKKKIGKKRRYLLHVDGFDCIEELMCFLRFVL